MGACARGVAAAGEQAAAGVEEATMTYRAITKMNMPDITPAGADMPEPVFERADPGKLLVDETYQRNLSERSVRLIRKIVAHWDWRTFMPPVVVKTKHGLHIIDGQHTAIAALTHPGIKTIPVMVVQADEITDRAKAFLGRNRDRITVTPNQLYAAAVAAGDEDAVTMHQVCERAGIKILKQPPAAGAFKIGETLAVSTIRALVSRRGALRARQILQVISEAKLAPVPSALIKATDEILSNKEYVDLIDPADLTTAIRSGLAETESEAKVFAATHNIPLWKAMTSVLFKRCKRGRRRAA
jgi:hypothetical protein